MNLLPGVQTDVGPSGFPGGLLPDHLAGLWVPRTGQAPWLDVVKLSNRVTKCPQLGAKMADLPLGVWTGVSPVGSLGSQDCPGAWLSSAGAGHRCASGFVVRSDFRESVIEGTEGYISSQVSW